MRAAVLRTLLPLLITAATAAGTSTGTPRSIL
nr:MAG TPA: hypothetical protein [Caudoviricetes sp.]